MTSAIYLGGLSPPSDPLNSTVPSQAVILTPTAAKLTASPLSGGQSSDDTRGMNEDARRIVDAVSRRVRRDLIKSAQKTRDHVTVETDRTREDLQETGRMIVQKHNSVVRQGFLAVRQQQEKAERDHREHLECMAAEAREREERREAEAREREAEAREREERKEAEARKREERMDAWKAAQAKERAEFEKRMMALGETIEVCPRIITHWVALISL